jgi:hypothetical protein
MKIRLMGTPQEIEAIQAGLAKGLEILESSAYYPNRGDSKLGRVYVEVQPLAEDKEGSTDA